MLTVAPLPDKRAHDVDTADSGMQTAQVTEMVTAVYQEQFDGTLPSWYTCSKYGEKREVA